MKITIKLAGMILIMLCHGACRTSKFSNRLVNKSTANLEASTLTRDLENKHSSRIYSISDSSGQVFQLTIFPVDSFRFSPQDGFIGKASKMELRGSMQQFKRVNDSSALKSFTSRETESNILKGEKAKEIDAFRVVEKVGVKCWWVVLVCIILLGVGVWLRCIRSK